MAGRGPAGSGARSRRRDQERLDERFQKVTDDGELLGPDLPNDVLPKGETWHARTRAWWDTWRRSPQAKTFGGTDWDFLLDTALMHHTMWSAGRWEFAAELRLRAAKFGATPEDRMRLKLRIVTPGEERPAKKPAQPSDVTDINSRRARLLSE